MTLKLKYSEYTVLLNVNLSLYTIGSFRQKNRTFISIAAKRGLQKNANYAYAAYCIIQSVCIKATCPR